MNNSKFEIDKEKGCLVNKKTGEAIPNKEPVFILPASNPAALRTIAAYKEQQQDKQKRQELSAFMKEVADYQEKMSKD